MLGLVSYGIGPERCSQFLHLLRIQLSKRFRLFDPARIHEVSLVMRNVPVDYIRYESIQPGGMSSTVADTAIDEVANREDRYAEKFVKVTDNDVIDHADKIAIPCRESTVVVVRWKIKLKITVWVAIRSVGSLDTLNAGISRASIACLVRPETLIG